MAADWLPPEVLAVLARVEQAGEEGWLVGGCVRDHLLRRPVHDYDIAVSCPPERTAAIFSGCELVLAGAAHGTVGVVAGGRLLELTTFRADGEYRDLRHPERVAFLPDIDGDLARRDFTVNAMAMDRRGRLRDPFGGREDLAARLLRSVGKPERRFSEDALRILRLARFAAKLGFSAEGETLAAALRLRRGTAALSAERVTAEVLGFAEGEHFPRAVGETLGLFAGVWPGLASVSPEALAALARAESPDSRLLLMAWAASREGWPAAAEAFCRKLRLPRDRERLLCGAARRLALPPSEDPAEVWRRACRFDDGATRLAFAVDRALDGSRKPEAALYERFCRAGLPRSVRELAVTGADLLAAGIPEGPAVGALLARLLEAVIDGQCENTRPALLARVRQEETRYGRDNTPQ